MDPLVSVELDPQGIPTVSVSPRELDQALQQTAPLQGMLGVEKPGSRASQQLMDVWEYFSETAQGEADLLYQIRQIENRMAPPKLGENRLGKLHQWVKTQRTIKQNEEYLQAL